MMKDHVMLFGNAKNKIFIFDAYGKLFKIIDVSLAILNCIVHVLISLFILPIAIIAKQPYYRGCDRVG